MKQELNNIDWEEELSDLSTEESWKLFKSKLQASVDKYVPTIKPRSDRRKKRYMTTESLN